MQAGLAKVAEASAPPPQNSNGEPKLKNYSREVRKGLSPFRGESPVLPDRVNPSIPDTIWGRLQNAGALAATHLELIMSDKRFDKLQMRDKIKLIELALGRSYGSVDGAVRKNYHVLVNPEDAKGFNALADMSRRAQRTLPEFRSTSEGGSPDDKGDD